jgi:hypothetical protein
MRVINVNGLSHEMLKMFIEISTLINDLEVEKKIIFLESLRDTANAALNGENNLLTDGIFLKEKLIYEKAWLKKYPFGYEEGTTMSLDEAKEILGI